MAIGLAGVGCGDGCGRAAAPISVARPSASVSAPTTSSQPNDEKIAGLVDERPYLLFEPAGKPTDEPLPLVLYLHGYGGSAAHFARHVGARAVARDRGWLAAAPDGTRDAKGLRFWNASEGCCNFENRKVDDVTYLSAVIEDVARRRRVDRSRVYVVGFSNGGFMAHRLACELGDRIAGIVSIAGAGQGNPDACRPKGEVAVLQIHGDADRAVPYEGGRTLNRPEARPHPPARETVAAWASRNGCEGTPQSGEPLDLDARLPGAETQVLRFEGCRGGAAELWTVRGGNHFVATSNRAVDAYLAFLER